MTPEEKRIHPRKPLRTRVVFEDELGEGLFYFLSTDISTGGIFIESDVPLRIGTKVFLKFSLFEGEKPIQVTGAIARHDLRGPHAPHSFGIGIQFLGLTLEDLKHIDEFLH